MLPRQNDADPAETRPIRWSSARTYYRQLAELLPLTVFEADESGNFLYVNGHAKKAFGYTEEDVGRGLSILQMIVPEDRQRAAENLAKVVRGEKALGSEYQALRKDGTTFPVMAYALPVMDEGRLAGYVGTLINITVQKRDRQRSHEHEVRFRAIFEQSPIGIAMTDRDTRFLQTNAAFQRMVGYTEEELANLSAMELTYPEDRERDRRLVGELALARENFSIEKRYVRKDGGLVWARVTVSLVRSPDGSYRYGIGMVEDITERKAAEEQLRQAQKMEAIGRLAGGVAHEFRNQLTVIKGYAEMLLRQDLVDEAGRQFVGDILQAVDRSVLISRELLAFGRKQVLHPERVRLDELVRRTAGSLSQLMGRDIEVSLRLHGGSSCVKVDANQFQQAVVNLALNARDAMPRGGRLMIQTAQVELDDRFAQENAGATAGPYVRIAVSDTGVGMDKETLEQVFEPFFTTKPAGEGIGLGLPMVYGFVRQSGGCVTVSSEPRHGTTVTLYLPLADDAGQGQ